MDIYVDTIMPIPISVDLNDNILFAQQNAMSTFASQSYTAQQQCNQSYLPWNIQTSQDITPGFASSNSAGVKSSNSRISIQQQEHQYQKQQHQQPVIQMQIPPRITTTTTSHTNNNTNTNTQSESRPQTMQPSQLIRWAQRPKFATSYWEEEGTLCYQVDANGICVSRRQDNDMVNGTKLLNVTGMSRGKRDGILKNEHARVVVKVGPMHLKGVWITFNRAKQLAEQFKITESLHPLLLEDPNVYLQAQNLTQTVQFIPPNQADIESQTQQAQNQFEARTFEHCEPVPHTLSFQIAPLVRPMESTLVDNSLTSNENYMTPKVVDASSKNMNEMFYYSSNNHSDINNSNVQTRVIPMQHHMCDVFDTSSNFNINQNQFNYTADDIIDFGDGLSLSISNDYSFDYHNQCMFSSDQSTNNNMIHGNNNTLRTPTISENSSAPPTPTDPTITFQLDHHQQQHIMTQQGGQAAVITAHPSNSYSQSFSQQDDFHFYDF